MPRLPFEVLSPSQLESLIHSYMKKIGKPPGISYEKMMQVTKMLIEQGEVDIMVHSDLEDPGCEFSFVYRGEPNVT